MRVGRQALAVAVAVVLASPVSASSQPVGVAGAASQATCGGVALVPGATVFSGDVVSVAERGRAQVMLTGAGMLGVEPNSAVRIHKTEASFEFELLRGKLRYKMPVGDAELRIANLRISNTGKKEAYLVVSLRTPTSGVIAALGGELRIAMDNSSKVVTLTEGKAVDVAAAPTPTPQGPAGAGSGLTRGQVLIVGASIIAGITAIALGLSQIESHPRPTAVSPFIP
jgi:hypothetical protein